MANLPELTSPVYCTDEDIAVRAAATYITLCPSWQQMAAGADGYFSPGSPWVLNSTLTNFAANGVAPNQVIWLSGPKSNYPGGGQLLAIDSVSGTSVTLRRLYKDLNVGQPPAPAAGLTNVVFAINTFDPQSAEASFDIKRRYGIDENIGRSQIGLDLRPPGSADGDRADGLARAILAGGPRRKGGFPSQDRVHEGGSFPGTRSSASPVGAARESAEPTTLFSCKLSR